MLWSVLDAQDRKLLDSARIPAAQAKQSFAFIRFCPGRTSSRAMLNTLGIVQVPRQAGGTISKVDRRLGDKPLLEVVVRRVTDCQRLDGVVVVLPGDASDAKIRRVVPPDVPVF